ncbi:hypothetical protein VPNG_02617 [Cytospora leucostoma]|uniref:Fe2OG dioxygenase domain-containing protein n=1 Tax=Cytospora leucostoma TaxID=1230097 RepID=A0A423XHR4_9PEZI|nr:hypothetical protein VPNG_02617 [Cytospora leucostoma]
MSGDPVDQLPILSDASLHTVDWRRLRANDENESRKLIEAGQTQGFFYLDMTSDEVFLQDWSSILQTMDLYFHRGLEEKMMDHRKSDTHGYEPVGTSSGAVKDLPDYYESLKASRKEVLSNSTETLPSIVSDNHSVFLRFNSTAHHVLMTVLRRFSINLCLGQDLELEKFHRDGQDSLTTLAMFRYPKQDTFTQWGLQVLSTKETGWHFVAPRKGHVVINVGDTLRFLSGYRLRSGVHRVMPTQDLQHEDRYSIAYFLRAEDTTVLFEGSMGRVVTAKDWHDEKFDVFREPHEKQEQARVLTGGMEQGEALISI